MIDIHAHILPGVDDGARDWEESMAMAQLSRQQGFCRIFATPHHSRRKGCGRLKELAGELQKRIEERVPGMSLILGEELYYYDDLVEDIKARRALTLGGSRFALVEFDPVISYETMYQAVRKMNLARFVPVIAHMERYLCLRRAENLEELMKCDCRMQMNYSSLLGKGVFNRDVRWCRAQVLGERVHYLATDMHRMDYRTPEVGEALKWLNRHVDEKRRSALVYDNAARIERHRKAGDYGTHGKDLR